MYPTTPYQERYTTRTEVVAIVDRYQIRERNNRYGYKVDPQREARFIKLIVNALGRDKRLVSILHEDDQEAIAAYGAEGYEIHTMNGDRPQALLQFVNGQYKTAPPEQLVVISNDAAFGGLCAFVAQQNTRVVIWSPSGHPPNDLMDSRFDARALNEVLPEEYIQSGTAAVWLDLENSLISLQKQGLTPSMGTFVAAIREEIADFGDITSLIAYADYTLLRETFGYDVQRELEKCGVRTRYQVNLHGKNSADMEIASDIHTHLEHNPTVGTVIIATGDRDFRPSVEAARARGKKVILLALKDNLSQELKRAADDVRYLDKYFAVASQPTIPLPSNEQRAYLLRLLNFLSEQRWSWVYQNRLPAEVISPTALTSAIQDGLLLAEQTDGKPAKLTLNPVHPLVKAATCAVWWIPQRVIYLIQEKGMPYVDTNYLARGMQMDTKCQEANLGQTRPEAAKWLEAAAAAGLIKRIRQAHPNAPEKLLDTWRPIGEVPATVQPSEKDLKPASLAPAESGQPQSPITGF